jgi:tRNA U34 5-carboxymethylaminomethyl modifying enzyme MnmG/GidA
MCLHLSPLCLQEVAVCSREHKAHSAIPSGETNTNPRDCPSVTSKVVTFLNIRT